MYVGTWTSSGTTRWETWIAGAAYIILATDPTSSVNSAYRPTGFTPVWLTAVSVPSKPKMLNIGVSTELPVIGVFAGTSTGGWTTLTELHSTGLVTPDAQEPRMTGRLAELRPGDQLEVWGPLGNGFADLDGRDDVALVAGGIGQTPFLAHVRDLLGTRGYGGRPPRRLAQKVSLYYGVRTADLAAGVEDFRSAGADVRLASDDGSLGFRGFVTQLLKRDGPPSRVFGCGPEPMLRALAALAARWGVPCQVSLETPMACGVGICFSCVTRVKTGSEWDYRRVCVEGPVFDAAMLSWE